MMLLVCNPGARAGRGHRRWQYWEAALREAGVPFRAVQTARLGHAVELARTAADCDVVVAVGGDGTINEVLDGVLQSGRAELAMGVLYAGTSPDFCRFHGIPVEPEQAVRALVAGETRAVDVARISYRMPDGSEQTAHFGCSCNIGLGAAIARDANRWRRYLGDVPGTGAALLRALLREPAVDLEIDLDGETLTLPRVNNLSVVKNPYLASGLRLQLDVQPDDGHLWLVAIHGQGRGGMLAMLPHYYSGAVTGRPGVLTRRGRTVTIRAAQPGEMEFDGDPRGWLPVRIELLPRALRLRGGTHAGV